MSKQYICNVATEEPLDSPKMDFSETKSDKSKSSEDAKGAEEQPMDTTPTMNFE